ncbi:MAG: TylF/MycF/NovP-related O-methyltransferase [Gaiellaceae bacterium]
MQRLKRALAMGLAELRGRPEVPADFSEADRALWRRVQPYTMTSPERIYTIARACEHVNRARIPGAVVECGVWRGGSMGAAALTLLAENDLRELWLYDTFTGMTEPGELDVRWSGESASAVYRDGWCAASLDDVQQTMRATGYPDELVRYVVGPVEETIPAEAPETIALLRLDTDWYESTRHELGHLWPRLAAGGVLIIDDYGHWQGARRAVDEYFREHPVLLSRIDRTARLAVKQAL